MAKTFGGTVSDMAFHVLQTSDGGYILTGETESFAYGYRDMYLVKTDSSGNLVRQKVFMGDGWDFANSVYQTSDGGYILAGVKSLTRHGGGDAFVVKTDSYGNLLWQKTFGGAGDDWAEYVEQTKDGGYILAGVTASFGAGGEDVYLIKTDTSGNAK